MKQSKVPKPSPQPPKSPAPAAPAGPRYRYYQTPPEKLSLRAGDLLALVPDAYWVRGYNAEKVIDLPAAEVLNGPVPRISVARLAELAPECFQAAGEDLKVSLPIARLARAYSLVTHSEVMKEPAPLIDIVLPPIDDKKQDADFAPREPEDALDDKKVTSRLTPFKLRPEPEGLVPLPPKAPESKEEANPAIETAPEANATAPEPAKVEPKESSSDKTPAAPEAPEKPGSPSRPARPFPFRRLEANAAEGETLLPPPPPTPVTETPAAPAQSAVPAPQPAPAPIQPPHAPAKTIFSMLPIFKRKAAAPPTPISAPPPPAPAPITKRARVELPPPKIHIAPPTPLGGGEQPLPAGFTPPPPPSPVDPLPKPETAPETVKLETAQDETSSREPATSVEATAKSAEPVKPPAIETPAPVTPPPAPEPPAAKFEPFAPVPTPEPAKIEPEKTAPLKPEPPKPQPLAKASPAVLVETEHLPKKGPDAVGNQDAIQSIFLTEEYLSVDRIVELCGALPGINSCVLSHGASVIASHNVPDSIDLVSLSAHALEMLRAMRESSAKMGIGAVPAVTIHSEKGPITFFHQEDLCLLVLHKDRGFIPGVREKLQQVMDALGSANLPKPLPSSHPATLEG